MKWDGDGILKTRFTFGVWEESVILLLLA
jgi:hypothetical protein